MREFCAGKLFILALSGLSACAAPQGESAADGVDAQFRHRVPFELGHSESQGDNTICIDEVWGTRPTIEVGGTYLVKGRYNLASADDGMVVLWETASNWNNSGYNVDTQCRRIARGAGEFTLLHGMPGPGYLHVVLRAASAGTWSSVANVYFGQGPTLLREKTW